MPRPGCPITEPHTASARSTATSPGTSSCAPKQSMTAALPLTPIRPTIHECSERRSMSRKLWPLAALVLVALTGAGCSSDSGSGGAGGDAAANQAAGLKFAEVVNGSGIHPAGPAWKSAIGACQDLQLAGFTGDHDVSDSEREARLAF